MTKYHEKMFRIMNQFRKLNISDMLPGISRMEYLTCLLYTSPSPRDVEESRMPSSA